MLKGVNRTFYRDEHDARMTSLPRSYSSSPTRRSTARCPLPAALVGSTGYTKSGSKFSCATCSASSACDHVASKRPAASSTCGRRLISPTVLRKIPGRASTHHTAASTASCSSRGWYAVALQPGCDAQLRLAIAGRDIDVIDIILEEHVECPISVILRHATERCRPKDRTGALVIEPAKRKGWDCHAHAPLASFEGGPFLTETESRIYGSSRVLIVRRSSMAR